MYVRDVCLGSYQKIIQIPSINKNDCVRLPCLQPCNARRCCLTHLVMKGDSLVITVGDNAHISLLSILHFAILLPWWSAIDNFVFDMVKLFG